MFLKTEVLPSFPPNSNPFRHDLWNMGQSIGLEHMMMFRNHPSEDLDYLIIVNTTTGERVKLSFQQEKKPMIEDIVKNPTRGSISR